MGKTSKDPAAKLTVAPLPGIQKHAKNIQDVPSASAPPASAPPAAAPPADVPNAPNADVPMGDAAKADTPKKKKNQRSGGFCYKLPRVIFTRTHVTYGSKQRSQPAYKYVSQTQFYRGSPVPRAPLLTKLLKFMNCQVATLHREKQCVHKIAREFFNSAYSNQQREQLVGPLIMELAKHPDKLEIPKKRQTVSKNAAARLLQAIDLFNDNVFGKSKALLNGAHVLKIGTLYRAFMLWKTEDSYFGPRFNQFLEPILEAFQSYLELEERKGKYDKKKEEYKALKATQSKALGDVLANQIKINNGTDLFYLTAVAGIGQRSSIEKVSQPVKTMMEIIHRCFVSEVIFRSMEIAHAIGKNNLREKQVLAALDFMNLKTYL